MKLRKITTLLAVLLFAFAVAACNDSSPTPAPAGSPAASEAA